MCAITLVLPKVSCRKRTSVSSKLSSLHRANFFLGLANPQELKDNIFMGWGGEGGGHSRVFTALRTQSMECCLQDAISSPGCRMAFDKEEGWP